MLLETFNEPIICCHWNHLSFLFIIIHPHKYIYIFRHIFISNHWWQESDIWSQASYRYPVLWEAFFDRSHSCFLFAEECGIAHISSCYSLLILVDFFIPKFFQFVSSVDLAKVHFTFKVHLTLYLFYYRIKGWKEGRRNKTRFVIVYTYGTCIQHLKLSDIRQKGIVLNYFC